MTLTPLTCNRIGSHVVYVKVFDATTGGRYEVRQAMADVAPPPETCPLFSLFALTRTNTVLTHKYGSEDWPLGQNRDAQTEIVFRPIRVDAGTSMYARVNDPADPSPYRSSVAHEGDNFDAAGTLSDSSYGAGSKTLTFTAGDSAKRLYLNTTTYAAGDNYVIQMSPDPQLATNSSFVCDATTNCQQTFPITAWKRVYLEKHEMFRNGLFIIRQEFSGQNQIVVQIPDGLRWHDVVLRAGDSIRLMHAPRFDGLDFQPDFHWEDGVVTAVDRVPGARNRRLVTLANPLQYSYSDDTSYQNAAAEGVSDGVGNLAAGTFARNESYLSNGFGSSFVQFVSLPVKVHEMPFMPILRNFSRFANKWFEHSPVNTITFARPGDSNVKNVLVGTGWASDNDPSRLDTGTFGATGVYVLNSSQPQLLSPNFSWTFAEAIEQAVRENNNPVRGLDPMIVNGENLVHELAHTFAVDFQAGTYFHGTDAAGMMQTDYGHCARSLAGNANLNCTMHSHYDSAFDARQKGDGVVGFHWVSDDDSEYMTIRRALEPLATPVR